MRVAKPPYCGAVNCKRNRGSDPDISFFRFPKDPERSKKWVLNCGRRDLENRDPMYLHNNLKLCSDHFELSQFMNSQRRSLVHDAVPTIFSVPNPPHPITPRIPDEQKMSTVLSLPAKKQKGIDGQGDVPEIGRTSNVVVVHVQAASPEPKDKTMETETAAPQSVQNNNMLTKTENALSKSNVLSPERLEILHLRKALRRKNSEINRLRQRYRKLKLQVRSSSKARSSKGDEIDTIISMASKYLKDECLQFFALQLKSARDNKFGYRWSTQDKHFALSLLHQSAESFKFLSEHFTLPSIRTLQRYAAGIRSNSSGQIIADEADFPVIEEVVIETCNLEEDNQDAGLIS